MERERVAVLVSVGLVALTLAAYTPLWHNEFINFDDPVWITENPHVVGGLTGSNVRWAWTTAHESNWVPLTWMSLQLDASLSPRPDSNANTAVPSPVVCHAQNLLWHTASVVLLFGLMRRMTGRLWPSAVVAALFAVHPLHVESVAWATERKDVLSTFFLLLTLAAYRRYVQQPSAARYALILLAFVLGLLAKPMLVTLPFALLLLDFWPLHRWHPAGQPAQDRVYAHGSAAICTASPVFPRASIPASSLGKLMLEKVPLLVVAAATSTVALWAHRSAQAVWSTKELPLAPRLVNAIVSYVWYLEKTLWPTDLAAFYPHRQESWLWGSLLVSGSVLATLTIVPWASARRWPWLAVGWLWFLGTLVPVIGLVQVGMQARADRYTYVPHIGLLIALVWTAAALLARLRVPGGLQAAAAVTCLAALSCLTWVQVQYWRNSETLWGHALAVTSDNQVAHCNMGNYFVDQGLAHKDVALLARAGEHFDRAIAIGPEDYRLRHDRGMLFLLLGQPQRAAEQFAAATQQNLADSKPLHYLAKAQLEVGRPADAEKSLRRGLAIKPRNADARALLGTALWRQGRHHAAAVQWEAALQVDPGEPEALSGLALLMLRQRNAEEAAQALSAAVQSDPSPARWSLLGVALGRVARWQEAAMAQTEAVKAEKERWWSLAQPPRAELALYRRRLAYALHEAGQTDAAAREYAAATALDPGWPQAALSQSWRLATDPDSAARDPQEAVELAQQACQAQLQPSAKSLDTLAAALAAAGQYPQAVTAARRALAQASPVQAPAMVLRLKQYEQGKAFVASKGDAPTKEVWP